jgi:hypothetical protein
MVERSNENSPKDEDTADTNSMGFDELLANRVSEIFG